MERHNRPPPLALPASPPAHLSALRYQHIHSSRPIMPPYVSSRRRLNRGIFAPLNSVAGVLFLTALLVTGSLTWFLTRAGTDRVSSPLSQLPDWPRQKAPNDILPNRFEPKDTEVANQTLNFQKIFAINLPSRLDRRDLLSIMSTVSDLAITIVPGVRTVAENSIPPPRIPGSLRMEEYAVWRAHANVWRRVIEEGLTTALILEDDNDWDVNLKEQIPRILHALEDIRKPPADTEDAVVRGGIRSEGWDMLYLGSCWEIPKTTDEYNRTTFIPIYGDAENIAQHNYNWVEDILKAHGHLDPPTRILQRAYTAQCTHSYAITSHGARKLLYYTSLHLDSRLDMAIVELVQQGMINAFTVIPPVMVQWKATENPTKDSDVGYDVWSVQNWGFVHSMRHKLRKDEMVGYYVDGEE